MMRKLIALLVAMLLCLGTFTACSANTPASDTSAPPASNSNSPAPSVAATNTPEATKPAELPTVTYYEESPYPPGPYEQQRARVFEKYGDVKVESVQASTEQTQALLASGNLPDIVRLRSLEELEIAIAGGMLLNLDAYIDQLPQTQKNAGASIEYARKNLSAGTGGLYALTFGIANNPEGPYAVLWGTPLYVRWDLYTAIGRPEAATLEDTIPILKAMQDYEPVTADGRKTYAIGHFPEWDGGSQFNGDGFGQVGYTNSSVASNNMVVDCTTGQILQNASRESPSYRMFKYYNALYRNGLIDPDCITQTYNIVNEKLAAGVYVAHMNSGNVNGYNTPERNNGDPPDGYVPLMYGDNKAVKAQASPLGYTAGQYLAVSSKANDVDACLRFIEVLSNQDAVLELYNGPQGDKWDVVDGKFTPTQKYWDWLDAGGEYVMDEGYIWQDSFSGQRFTLSGSFFHDAYGVPLNMEYFDDIVKKKNDTKVMQEWADFYGYPNQNEYMIAKSRNYFVPYACSFMPPVPEEFASIKPAITSYVVDTYWQLIYTDTEAGFEKLWDQMEADVKALGGDEFWTWGQQAWLQANATAKDLGLNDMKLH